MALHDYLVSEVREDCADGLIGRREALRRLGLLGLSATAAATVLAACGGDDDDAAEATTTAAAGTTSAAATATTATSTAAASTTAVAAGTTAGATTTAAGGTVTASEITFAGPAGELKGWFAPAADPKGAVLIIHENRGLTDHFQDLPGRFAASGYSALAVDLLSRAGGTSSFADSGAATAALGQTSQDDLTADMRAGLDELARRAPGAKLAAVGFCFGGGQVWQLVAAGDPRLAAAVPFYGPGPSDADFSGSQAAVLGVYAENDSRVNASMDAMESALTTAGLPHELRVFPGVDHAFFNDTGARYNAEQAAAAYQAVLDWFGQHLAS
jgi:carboxymethylenebutenolidase